LAAIINYPFLRLRIIVPRLGLFPYMSRKVLTILTVKSSPPATDSNRTTMLRTICQAATSVEPSRIISVTGAVRGKIVRTTKAGLLGNIIIKEETQSGETAARVNITEICCPSRAEELIAPIPVEITANKR
jgi:hypothetical protein